MSRHPRAASPEHLREIADSLPAAELHLAAFHPCGSARMGADQQTCPVGREGRLRGTHGVYVADASVLPSCPTVNPQITIMAMALAIGQRIRDTAGR